MARRRKRLLIPKRPAPPPPPKFRVGPPRTSWPPRMELELIGLMNGGLKPRQIAGILTHQHAFPVTRNAVIGKIYRLRADGALTPAQKPGHRTNRRAAS